MAKTKIPSGAGKAKRRLATTERHIVLCADTGEAACAGAKEMRRAWKHLGARLEKAGLDGKRRVLRTRARCMGICAGGPILAVYPDGVWYGGCDPEAIDRIVEEHLLGGEIVEELVLHRMTPSAPRRDRQGSR